MSYQKSLPLMIGLTLVSLFLAGCDGPQAMQALPTPEPGVTTTPVPPTATSVLPSPTSVPTITAPTATTPTQTPACPLECDGRYDARGAELLIDITCESGKFTGPPYISWKTLGSDGRAISHFESERTYEDTGNTYHIVEAVKADVLENGTYNILEDGTVKANYHVEVTGGAFGDTPQMCGNVSPQYFGPLPTSPFFEEMRENE